MKHSRKLLCPTSYLGISFDSVGDLSTIFNISNGLSTQMKLIFFWLCECKRIIFTDRLWLKKFQKKLEKYQARERFEPRTPIQLSWYSGRRHNYFYQTMCRLGLAACLWPIKIELVTIMQNNSSFQMFWALRRKQLMQDLMRSPAIFCVICIHLFRLVFFSYLSVSVFC